MAEAKNVVASICDEVRDEVYRAQTLHNPMANAHESYAVILEEVEEFWDEVKLKQSKRDLAKMRSELIQIAAMAIRSINDLRLAR